MASESSNVPVTTFIALGLIAGLFIVFQSTRDPDQPDQDTTPDNDVRPHVELRETDLPVPRRLQSKSAEQSVGRSPQGEPERTTHKDDGVWRSPREGVYCLTEDCTSQRISAGATLPCQDDDCHQARDGHICIEDDCRTFEEIQGSPDFAPASRRLSQRVQDHITYEGALPTETITIELMMNGAGRVGRFRTVKSSGSESYDEAVRQAVYVASPFLELAGTLPHTQRLLQLVHLRIDPTTNSNRGY
ncbi:TonB C-terminal domain-containing protein [Halomonas sp. 86]|uniref:TonB C-terminal domain-containing protein n=1 Tax=unclassified Halomonas TaxID=2609666 RepID=UPI004033EE8A